MMRNWIFRIGALSLLLSIGLWSFGQGGSDAKSLAQNLSKKYNSYKNLTAQFELLYEGKPQQKGSIIIENGTGKYKIELPEQTIISDGKSQWSILKDVKEVQITDVPKDENGISPKNLFTFFNKGYAASLLPETKKGDQTWQVVALHPDNKNKSHEKIELSISKGTQTLQQIKIFEKNGDQFIYVLQQQKPNQALSAQTFVFDKKAYPGFEIVDLR